MLVARFFDWLGVHWARLTFLWACTVLMASVISLAVINDLASATWMCTETIAPVQVLGILPMSLFILFIPVVILLVARVRYERKSSDHVDNESESIDDK